MKQSKNMYFKKSSVIKYKHYCAIKSGRYNQTHTAWFKLITNANELQANALSLNYASFLISIAYIARQ